MPQLQERRDLHFSIFYLLNVSKENMHILYFKHCLRNVYFKNYHLSGVIYCIIFAIRVTASKQVNLHTLYCCLILGDFERGYLW